MSPFVTEFNETKQFYNNLLTDYTSKSILLKENFIRERMSYRIKFRVRTEYEADEYTHYDFRTNTPPERGTCTLDKSTGKAVLDKFQLTCRDWIDVDLPLRYSFIRSFVQSSTCSSLHSFIPSLICNSFILSFDHSLVCSFCSVDRSVF